MKIVLFVSFFVLLGFACGEVLFPQAYEPNVMSMTNFLERFMNTWHPCLTLGYCTPKEILCGKKESMVELDDQKDWKLISGICTPHMLNTYKDTVTEGKFSYIGRKNKNTRDDFEMLTLLCANTCGIKFEDLWNEIEPQCLSYLANIKRLKEE